MQPVSSPSERQERLAAFLEALVPELVPLHRAHHEAVWLANTTGERRHEEESARLDTAIRTIFSRRESYALLRELAESGRVDDPLLDRQLTLLLNDHRANQIPPESIEAMVRLEKSLESRFNHFRARLDGQEVTDNQLRERLKSSSDGGERRRAWESSKQVGQEVVGGLLELVRLRNQAARELGFSNYYSMMLELDELDETELFAVLDQLEAGTQAPFEEYKSRLDADLARRFACPAGELAPWHYSDPFFQEAPAADVGLDRYFEGRPLEEITERFFGALGFDIRPVLARSDLYERAGKCQHAFCLSNHGADTRVLCNLRGNEYWMGTLLHEFGHAVYDEHVSQNLPYLLRGPAHILLTEASAMLFGRLSKNAAWLVRWAETPQQEAVAIAARLAETTRAQLLVQTRWCLVMCHMERALYRDPGQDLGALWWDLVERFQRLRAPAGRRAQADWASKIHFTVAPVYYHNYLLGEMTASQLQSHLLGTVLGGGPRVWERYVESPQVGTFLRDRVYAGGKSLHWRETLRRATGSVLEPASFVAELARPD